MTLVVGNELMGKTDLVSVTSNDDKSTDNNNNGMVQDNAKQQMRIKMNLHPKMVEIMVMLMLNWERLWLRRPPKHQTVGTNAIHHRFLNRQVESLIWIW